MENIPPAERTQGRIFTDSRGRRIRVRRRDKIKAKITRTGTRRPKLIRTASERARIAALRGDYPLTPLAEDLGSTIVKPADVPDRLLVYTWARRITTGGDDAAVLSMLLYAAGKPKKRRAKNEQRLTAIGPDGKPWVSMSREDIAKRVGLSRDQLDRSIGRLAKAGLAERPTGQYGLLRPVWGVIRNAVRALYELPAIETADVTTTDELLGLLAADDKRIKPKQRITWFKLLRRKIPYFGRKAGPDRLLVLGQFYWLACPISKRLKTDDQRVEPEWIILGRIPADDDGDRWWWGTWGRLFKGTGIPRQQLRRAVRELVKAKLLRQQPVADHLRLRLDYDSFDALYRSLFRRELDARAAAKAARQRQPDEDSDW
jgi:hypothetical protein